MSLDQNLNKILIIDFGSQFTQLIARRVRELGVFSEIVSHKKIKLKDINHSIKGIVLSGGPLNVYQINKYSFDKKILQLDVPVLGICFGHQILSKLNGGRVKQSKHREFGLANVYKKNNSLLTTNFFGNKKSKKVWMSHADQVSKLPKNFKVVASSTNSKFAIVENIQKAIKDKSVKAQMGVPDMKVPIQYALSYPERLNNDSGALDFEEMKQLNFFAPDLNRYPCLNLAMNLAHEEGNSIPIMSIANDYVVELFLNGEIGFIDIANTIEKTVNKFHSQDEPTIEDLVQLNKEIKVYLGSKL